MQTHIIKVFFAINLFFITLLSTIFLIFNHNYKILDFIFTLFALISTIFTIYLLYYIFTRFFFKFKATIYVLAIIFTITNIILIGDFILYKVWGFHINGMVLNIITSPAAYDSLFISKFSAFIIAILIILLILLQIYIFNKVTVTNLSEKVIINLVRIINLYILPLLFSIVIFEKLTYALSAFKENSYIVERTKVIPGYISLTMNSFFTKRLGMKKPLAKNINVKISKIINIKYPMNPIEIKNKSTPNIFIFGVDALKESIISKEVTPNIVEFRNQNIYFKYNISGGNCTRFGLFSLFYGINSNYWFGFLNAKKGSVLFDVLKKSNYQISLISSANFTWPEFKKTAFCNVKDKIKDDFKGSSVIKDRKTIDYFKKWIDKQDTSQPIFSFIWLDSVHSREYPNEFKKFLPDNGGYITATKKNHNKQFNRYKNSALYIDSLFKEFIEKLKSKKLYENSIIIFTSDHGEEFFEYGFYSHDSAYDREQVNTPLIIHMPGKSRRVITKMTSHLDIVPTLMHELGVTNNTRDYSHGYYLFDNNYARKCTFVGNWNENAIVCNQYTIIISNIIPKSLHNEIRDSQNYKILTDYNKTYVNKILIDSLNENRLFRNN